MVMKKVGSCPTSVQAWQQSAQKCDSTDHYHCLFNEFHQTVSGCIDPIWVEEGYCPLYNSKALKLDTEKCHDGCPNGNYRSFDVYKYSGCYSSQQPSSSSTAAVTDITDTPGPLPPGGSSFNVAAVVVPVLLVIIIINVVVSAVFIYRRYKGERTCTTDSSKRKQNRISRRMLSCSCFHWVSRNECNVENAPLNQLQEADENIKQTEERHHEEETQKTESKFLSREEFLQHENINIENLAEDTSLVLELGKDLKKCHTLALIGKWGSGKRTLAVQIALQVEKIENKTFKYKVLQEFQDDICSKLEALKTTDPTILLIPDLCRSWHTEQHTTDIIECVRSILSSNIYIIATIQNTVYKSCTPHTLSSIDGVFTRREFKPSRETLSKLVDKCNFTGKFRTDVLKLNAVIGTPLIVTLCMKNPVYTTSNFFDEPLSFIISELKKMKSFGDVNARMKFEILVYIMLHGGTIEKNILENCSDPSLLAITGNIPNMLTYIQDRVTELLCGYLEETADGKSYRISHEVITRCIFLAAAEGELLSLFGKCDAFLLFDCIRLNSKLERLMHKRQIIFVTEELKVGIPTEIYQDLAKALKKRNDDMMILLRKVNLFEEKEFQKVWISISEDKA